MKILLGLMITTRSISQYLWCLEATTVLLLHSGSMLVGNRKLKHFFASLSLPAPAYYTLHLGSTVEQFLLVELNNTCNFSVFPPSFVSIINCGPNPQLWNVLLMSNVKFNYCSCLCMFRFVQQQYFSEHF